MRVGIGELHHNSGWVAAILFVTLAIPQRAHAQAELPESCRNGVSADEIVRSARARARFDGLKPVDGDTELRMTKLEGLTAEEHDRRYPDDRLMGHFPPVEPEKCFWRVELEGVGEWCGGRFPGTCTPIFKIDVAFRGATGSVVYESIHFDKKEYDFPPSCRTGVSSDRVISEARAVAVSNGLQPPSGMSTTSIYVLEALTAEEHDRRYPEDRLIGQGQVVVEPEACFWRVELAGVGWFFGEPPGSGPRFMNQIDLGITGATGEVKYDVIRFSDDPWRVWVPLGLRSW